MLHHSVLEHSYSTLAMSALTLAHIMTNTCFSLEAVQSLMVCDVVAVKACMSDMAYLHNLSLCSKAVKEHHMQPVHDKYCSPEWAGVARLPAVSAYHLDEVFSL